MSAARMFAQQASITEMLMRDLLPPTLRQIGGVEFAGGYRASQDHERVGGDFYDVHPPDDERTRPPRRSPCSGTSAGRVWKRPC